MLEGVESAWPMALISSREGRRAGAAGLEACPTEIFPKNVTGVQSGPMKTLTALLVCCVLCATCFPQAESKMDWGEKFNSNGATLVVKEGGRSRVNGKTVITYNLFVSGLPRDAEYTLWMKLVGSNPQAVANAFINKDGLIVNVLSDPAHNIAEDPINLKVVAGRGEPKQFAVIANDGRQRVFGQVVPFPIERASGPCNISATMMGPNYNGVSVVVTGLQPNEEFQTTQQSGSEGGTSKAAAVADGSYKTLIFPFVKGQPSGTLRFKVSAKVCAVDIEVPWGQSSYAIQ
jgi:hypothetical protein